MLSTIIYKATEFPARKCYAYKTAEIDTLNIRSHVRSNSFPSFCNTYSVIVLELSMHDVRITIRIIIITMWTLSIALCVWENKFV